MKIITAAAIADLTTAAADSPRLRCNLNLHPQLSDPIQRLFNAFEPGSYVRPHRHDDPSRWEVFVAIRGSAVVLGFDDAGAVTERVVIGPGEPAAAVEIPGGVWHTVASLATGTVLFELKPGPYSPLQDKDFASWAPAEGDPACTGLTAWFCRAGAGERFPGQPPR
jgi:cupin fold WbuC family metalloprotein